MNRNFIKTSWLVLSFASLFAAGLFVSAAESLNCPFEKALRDFRKAYQTKDISLVENIYGDKVIYLPGWPTAGVKKRDELFKEVFEGAFGNENAEHDIEFRIAEKWMLDGVAIVAGAFEFRNTENGETNLFHGKFQMVFQQLEDGSWKAVSDADSACPKEYWDSLK